VSASVDPSDGDACPHGSPRGPRRFILLVGVLGWGSSARPLRDPAPAPARRVHRGISPELPRHADEPLLFAGAACALEPTCGSARAEATGMTALHWLHVAIIMDGGGRWALGRGLARTEGHRGARGAARRPGGARARRADAELFALSSATGGVRSRRSARSSTWCASSSTPRARPARSPGSDLGDRPARRPPRRLLESIERAEAATATRAPPLAPRRRLFLAGFDRRAAARFT
jgi:hypothetical protein